MPSDLAHHRRPLCSARSRSNACVAHRSRRSSVDRRRDRSQRGRQAAGYELVRWTEAGRTVGVQSDSPATRGRITGQVQDLQEVPRSASAAGRSIRVRRVPGS